MESLNNAANVVGTMAGSDAALTVSPASVSGRAVKTVRVPLASTPDEAVAEDKQGSSQRTKDEYIKLLEMADFYRADMEAGRRRKTRRKPRIPDTILDAIRNKELDISRAISMLGVSRAHLYTALKRTASSDENASSGLALHSPQANETPSSVSSNEISEGSNKMKAMHTSNGSDLRGRRGPEAERIVREAVGDYYREHNELPTRNYLKMHHQIGHVTAAKYWPKLEDLGITTPKMTVSTASHEAMRDGQSTPDRELVRMVSELVFGDELVAGTYLDDSGAVLCDHVEHGDRGYRLYIRAWRKREADVARIITLAHELRTAL
ncbi:hypothetical protein AB9E14_07525 [Rhizobium leguminosarum]|uniref:hypothetical protein n=1 Tax=Rhizobium leguminosarum TaxID=384 RepID=UPI003F94B483